MRDTHIALQFGHIKHFNEGLSEFSRQLALQYAGQARQLKEERKWHFHFILPKQWHGMFGDAVTYHDVTDRMRWRHHFDVPLDVWHGLHQHMRYRPPLNSRHNIVTVHDLNYLYAKTGLSKLWQNMRLTRQLRRADQLVAISQYVAHDLASHLPWTPQASVIYNGAADLTRSEQQPVRELADRQFLLHISRMSPSKNVSTLIDMAAIWPGQLLVLAGPQSPEVESHRQHIARAGLNNVFVITDITEAQKAWLYAKCLGFLFPSLMEGFGLPPIEAMYFGKPVIAAQRTCLPEVCGDGAAYWNDFTPHSMRQVVENHVMFHQRNEHSGANVRQQALRYTWSGAARRYMTLYEGHTTTC